VYDVKNNKRLVANIELIDLKTGTTVATVKSDLLGNYLVPLPIGKDYAFNVNKKGYLFYSDNFSLASSTQDSAFFRDIPLSPLDTSAILVLHNVFFDTREYTLKTASTIELDRLVTLMKDNPTMIVEISGHTDDVGNDQTNLTLSANRAKAVVQYMMDKGIAADRMIARGYGESKPVADNSTEAGRAQNRRTEFKIIKL
jgi:outer membrane protein OmpA-like peptidoglycan-associated protein